MHDETFDLSYLFPSVYYLFVFKFVVVFLQTVYNNLC